MRVESNDQVVLGRVVQAFTDARDDTLEEAQRIAAEHTRTGDFERSLQVTTVTEIDGNLVTRVGSPLVSAKTKEKGAYIVPKSAASLVFDTANGVRRARAVRVPATPIVTPAGKRYPEYMAQRFREQR